MLFDVDWRRQFYQNVQPAFYRLLSGDNIERNALMRIWHVFVVLAAVVMFSAAQPARAQTSKPAISAPVDDAVEKGSPVVAKPDQPAGQQGGTTTQASKPDGGLFGNPQILIVMVAVMALLWWWMGRGRRKEQQRHKDMLSALKKGDKVTSIGGIIGTVIEVKDKEVVVKIDESSNTRMKFLRSAIRSVGAVKDEEVGQGPGKS